MTLVKIKRSSTIPVPGSLTFGELALSSIPSSSSAALTKLYAGDANNNVVELIGPDMLSNYTAGNGININSGAITVKPLETATSNLAPITVSSSGLSVPIDGSTITLNSSGQLQSSSPNTIDAGNY